MSDKPKKRGRIATPKQNREMVMVTLRMSPELHAAMCEESALSGLSMNVIGITGIECFVAANARSRERRQMPGWPDEKD